MGFVPKDWINETDHAGPPASPPGTPISGASLEDLEIRVTDYTNSKTPISVTEPPYNATGDGVTDDTTAIQDAIDAASAGDTIYFPRGTYFCAGLEPKSGLTFRADGNAVLKLRAATAAPIFTWGNPFVSVLSDVTWDGLTFEGVAPGGTSNDYAIYVRGGIRISILNCHAYDFYAAGFGIFNVSDVLVRGNRLENCCAGGQPNAIHWSYDTLALAPDYGRIVITDNICVAGTDYHHTAGICVQSNVAGVPLRTVVANNVCEDWDWYGIIIEGGAVESQVIANNVITNCAYGIGVGDTTWINGLDGDDLTNTIIANNLIRPGARSPTSGGVTCSVSRAVISGNVVEVNGGNCLSGGGNDNPTPDRISSDQLIANNIFIQNASSTGYIACNWSRAVRVSFHGNQWHARGGATGSTKCFYVSNVDGFELKDERIEGPFDERCIELASGTKNIHIHGCTLKDPSNSSEGIYIEEATPEVVTITDNVMVGGTGIYGGIWVNSFTGSRIMNNVLTGTYGAGGIVDGGGSPKYANAEGNKTSESSSLASAATITLPLGYDVVTITGTTSITSVTASWVGRRATLIFSDANPGTFTDGSNLKLAGNFDPDPDDTITLVCDGTNWYEVARSVN